MLRFFERHYISNVRVSQTPVGDLGFLLHSLPGSKRAYSLIIIKLALLFCGTLLAVAEDRGIYNSGPYPLTENKPRVMQSKPVQTGLWGGTGISMIVSDKGAAIEYPCADGEITEAIKTDKNGNFNVPGVHIRQRPGPVRVDAKPDREAVRFEGRVTNKTMKLKVVAIKGNEVLGEYSLALGARQRMHRCL